MPNPQPDEELLLHSPKLTVWCGFTADFIIGPLFNENIIHTGPHTCSITKKRYLNILTSLINPQFLKLMLGSESDSLYAGQSTTTNLAAGVPLLEFV